VSAGKQTKSSPEKMIWEILHQATTAAMLSFVVSSMLAMGTGLTVAKIVAALRNRRLIIVALLANFVVMPLGALVLAKVLWLDEPLGVGLLLLGCAAGALIPAETGTTIEGQSSVCGRRNGPVDDHHRSIPADRSSTSASRSHG
jgi:hypothetical protein